MTSDHSHKISQFLFNPCRISLPVSPSRYFKLLVWIRLSAGVRNHLAWHHTHTIWTYLCQTSNMYVARVLTQVFWTDVVVVDAWIMGNLCWWGEGGWRMGLCMHVSMRCMSRWINGSTHLCIHISIYGWMNIGVYLCIYVCMPFHWLGWMGGSMDESMSLYMYIFSSRWLDLCASVCVYLCMPFDWMDRSIDVSLYAYRYI